MSVKLIVGYKGDGKTLLATFMAYRAHVKNLAVYANYNLKFKHLKLNLASSYNSLQFSDCLIVIDESQMYIDSRNFGRNENKLLGYLFLQTRKRGVNVVMTAHQGSMIDIRVRENLDYVYKVTALVRTELGYKRASIEDIEGEIVEMIHVQKLSIRSGDMSYFLFDPARYFSMYDTHEFVDIMEGN